MGEKEKDLLEKLAESVRPPIEAFADVVSIWHKFEVFHVLFQQKLPDQEEPRTVGRIWCTPAFAKQFRDALTTNIRLYEQAHGEIRIPTPQKAEEP